MGCSVCMFVCLSLAGHEHCAVAGDEATHETDHHEDVVELPEVHVHGLPLNKDQQLGPVPKSTPWPASASLRWKRTRRLDESAHAGFQGCESDRRGVGTGQASGTHHRRHGALKKWAFDPQLKGDKPVDGELTVRIHFRTR